MTVASPDPEDAVPVTERDRIEGWRLHVLIQAGYPVPLAERIAAAPVDLHQAIDLIRSGCSAELAVEILT